MVTAVPKEVLLCYLKHFLNQRSSNVAVAVKVQFGDKSCDEAAIY